MLLVRVSVGVATARLACGTACAESCDALQLHLGRDADKAFCTMVAFSKARRTTERPPFLIQLTVPLQESSEIIDDTVETQPVLSKVPTRCCDSSGIGIQLAMLSRIRPQGAEQWQQLITHGLTAIDDEIMDLIP